jgi:dihydropyrimidine dehydrogenase (NAD+) subunit PreA
MVEVPKGGVDQRTGRTVGDYANWTMHPNNPSVTAAE